MRPPQHSVDAEIEFILETDPAWDRERANDELQDMGDDEDTEHPLIKYYVGDSRFDLDAEGIRPESGPDGQVVLVPGKARDYLKPDVQPRVFRLRRLRAAQVSRCMDVGGRTGQQLACQQALSSIDPPIAGLKLKARKRPLVDDELQQLADAVGMDAVWEIGKAAIEASKAPTEQEKKASAS